MPTPINRSLEFAKSVDLLIAAIFCAIYGGHILSEKKGPNDSVDTIGNYVLSGMCIFSALVNLLWAINRFYVASHSTDSSVQQVEPPLRVQDVSLSRQPASSTRYRVESADEERATTPPGENSPLYASHPRYTVPVPSHRHVPEVTYVPESPPNPGTTDVPPTTPRSGRRGGR